jgi:hypothetical protein
MPVAPVWRLFVQAIVPAKIGRRIDNADGHAYLANS